MNKKTTTKNKQQDKKWFITTIVLIIIVIISCLSLMFINMSRPLTNQNDTNQTTQHQTYQTIGNDDLTALLNESETTNIIYVGRDTCPHCSAFAPKLIEAIQANPALVYYYDTAAARAENADKMSALVDQLGVSSVPALLKVENGQVVERLNDYESLTAIAEFLK